MKSINQGPLYSIRGLTPRSETFFAVNIPGRMVRGTLTDLREKHRHVPLVVVEAGRKSGEKSGGEGGEKSGGERRWSWEEVFGSVHYEIEPAKEFAP